MFPSVGAGTMPYLSLGGGSLARKVGVGTMPIPLLRRSAEPTYYIAPE
jgi:hypothetical protein